jgi:hypothetical protein
MKRVVIESPYAGNVRRNVRYAIEAVKHSLSLGEAPIASHLLFPENGIVDEKDPNGRLLGIAAGLAWLPVADLMASYIDYGESEGMRKARLLAEELGIRTEFRKIR